MKQHVLVIHGGRIFETHEAYLKHLRSLKISDLEYFRRRDWKDSLERDLGSSFEVVMPRMPNKDNARYSEWKIMLEKILPLLNDEVVLVGHSLGGLFLAAFLSENASPCSIRSAHLVSAPFDLDDVEGGSLADFTLPDSLKGLADQSPSLELYHSRDDEVVGVTALEKYAHALPHARTHLFEDRGHFKESQFPEIVENIRSF